MLRNVNITILNRVSNTHLNHAEFERILLLFHLFSLGFFDNSLQRALLEGALELRSRLFVIVAIVNDNGARFCFLLRRFSILTLFLVEFHLSLNTEMASVAVDLLLYFKVADHEPVIMIFGVLRDEVSLRDREAVALGAVVSGSSGS